MQVMPPKHVVTRPHFERRSTRPEPALNERKSCRTALALLAAAVAVTGLHGAQLLAPSALSAQTAPVQLAVVQPPVGATGLVRGVVFDSLAMKPLARATVMLMGTGRSATSNDRGDFGFDSVAVGTYEIGFAARAPDSAGLGVLGTAVTVSANGTLRATLTTPSLRTLWKNRCRPENTFGTDSSIVWGTVRDAANDLLLANAVAVLSWYDLRPKISPALLVDEIRRETPTDVSGHYFACGLPHDILIANQAVGRNAASGRVEFAVGARRVHKVDLMVSSDMVLSERAAPITREDSLAAGLSHGQATLRGLVVDEKGLPLADATVLMADLDTTVRTGADGQFRFAAVPAGSQMVYVRRVGSGAITQIVHLRPNVTTETTVHLSSVNTLAPVNVRSEKVIGRDRLDFEFRQRMGFGYTADEKSIARQNSLYNVLKGFPGLTVRQTGSHIAVTMKSGAGNCAPTVYLDGNYVRSDVAFSYQIEHYRAVEVYTRYVSTPAEFARKRGCGAIVLWTKGARW
ncbi:MAG: carboxypeptidase regulatory-like domain-containing protein [Phycisphaerae bacterium]|nr:carboxypeptidase regulatory-like domain-containing protein [Gemmatimonadaceae bacterium]